MNANFISDVVCTVLRVTGSTIFGKHSAVLVGGKGGVPDIDLENKDGEAAGELATDTEGYGALGIVVRPRPPSVPQGEVEELAAEARALRTTAGLFPVSWRDLRLNRRFPAPKPGTVALVGYGGGFLSFDDADGDTSLGTLYVPYERNGSGNVTKAHMLSMGRDGSGKPFVGLISGEGPRLTMLEDLAVLASKDGANRLEVGDGGVVAVGPLKAASGADLGGPTSVPLAKFAQLAAYVTALEVNVLAITWPRRFVNDVGLPSGS